LNPKTIASLIDHSLLRPDATGGDIRRLCEEALNYGFFSVCVNPCHVGTAKEILRGSAVKVAAVIGFPLGVTLTEVKVYEAMNADLLGADELDVVINLGALKSGSRDIVRKELSEIIMVTRDLVHKTIIETCYLTDDEKKEAVETALQVGSEFIKTSTGFGRAGARLSDVRLIKRIVGEEAGIKAAGGIRTLREVLAFLDAGATRIGTSAGVTIIEELSGIKGV